MIRLVKNYLYNILSLLTGALFPFLIFPYISRILMPENLGKVAFVQSITNYFIMFGLFGVSSYGIRELSKDKISSIKNAFSKTFTELLIISMFFSLISFFVFIIFIIFNQKMNNLKLLGYIYSFQVLCAFLNLDYVFISLEEHKRRTIRALLLRLGSMIFIFSFIKSSNDYWIYGVIIVFPEIIARILDIYHLRGYIHIKKIEINLKRHMKPLVIIFLYVFSSGVYVNFDTTILGFLQNDIQVGIYSVGTRLVKMLIPIISVLGTVMSPSIIGYIKKDDKVKVYEMIDNYIDFNLIFGTSMVILIFFLSKDIILLVSGKEFLEANIIMRIISIIIIIIPIGTFFGGQILLPNEKESIILKISIIGMVLNIILNMILIKYFSIVGAAISIILTESMICFYRLYEVKKIYPQYEFITKERKNYSIASIISFSIVYLIIYLKKFGGFYNILFITSIYTTVYISVLFFIKNNKIYYIIIKFMKREL